MAKSTNNIVADLYALRAGLSLISCEKDKFVAEVEAAGEREKSEIADARAKAEKKFQELKQRLEPEKEALMVLQDSEKKFEDRKMDFEQAKAEYDENEKIIEDTRYSELHYIRYKRNRVLRLLMGIMFVLTYVALDVLLPLCLFLFGDRIFFPIVAIAMGLLIEIIEFVMAAKEYDLEEIWYGAPYILNVLSYGILLMLLINGNMSGFWFFGMVFPVAMISAIACAVFTGLRTSSYFGDDTGMIEYNQKRISEHKRALAKRNEKKDRMDFGKQRLDEAERIYENAQIAFENRTSVDLDAMKVEGNSIEAELDAECEEFDRRFASAKDEAANTYGKVCTEIWNALTAIYGELLDPRDWNILDLVIWQLETGRADSIKEALQLADRETQTDRIVATMQTASTAITQSINNGFGKLQSQLTKSFCVLAGGLANSTRIITESISRSSETLGEKIDASSRTAALLGDGQRADMLAMNRNLEQLFSQSSLQTALLEKSSSTCGKLMDDVRSIRAACE